MGVKFACRSRRLGGKISCRFTPGGARGSVCHQFTAPAWLAPTKPASMIERQTRSAVLRVQPSRNSKPIMNSLAKSSATDPPAHGELSRSTAALSSRPAPPWRPACVDGNLLEGPAGATAKGHSREPQGKLVTLPADGGRYRESARTASDRTASAGRGSAAKVGCDLPRLQTRRASLDTHNGMADGKHQAGRVPVAARRSSQPQATP